MALTNEELIEELSNKPIMEVVDLVKALEEKWGVSAAAPVAVAAGPAADAGAAAADCEAWRAGCDGERAAAALPRLHNSGLGRARGASLVVAGLAPHRHQLLRDDV